MRLGKLRKRTLKIKVGGNKVQITPEVQSEEVQFLDKLDRELSIFDEVFKCLSTIDKSLYPDCEKRIVIHLQCRPICLGRKFCQKVITSMEAELTEKMQQQTHISTEGFVNFS